MIESIIDKFNYWWHVNYICAGDRGKKKKKKKRACRMQRINIRA